MRLPLSGLDKVAHRLVDVGVNGRDEEGLLLAGEAVQVQNLHLLGNGRLSRLTSTEEEQTEGQAGLLLLGELGIDVLVRLEGLLVEISSFAARHGMLLLQMEVR